jgi:hypothetical protein
MRRISGLLFLALLYSGAAASDDSSPPFPNCPRPLKQSQFSTQLDLDRYKGVVDHYRSCLEAFVKEQEKAIETHQRAAQSAIEEWNRFVGQEKKEPPPKAPENSGLGDLFRIKP